jgi:hypothetical protein
MRPGQAQVLYAATTDGIYKLYVGL